MEATQVTVTLTRPPGCSEPPTPTCAGDTGQPTVGQALGDDDLRTLFRPAH